MKTRKGKYTINMRGMFIILVAISLTVGLLLESSPVRAVEPHGEWVTRGEGPIRKLELGREFEIYDTPYGPRRGPAILMAHLRDGNDRDRGSWAIQNVGYGYYYARTVKYPGLYYEYIQHINIILFYGVDEGVIEAIHVTINNFFTHPDWDQYNWSEYYMFYPPVNSLDISVFDPFEKR